MHRFMHVCFGFPGVPKVLDLEPVFSAMSGSDWLRYSATNWIMWTDKTQAEIYNFVIPRIDVGDFVLISPMNVTEMFGRLPPWVWEWINTKSSQAMFSVPNYDNDIMEILKTLSKPQA